ncbi:MAG: J domain-containing protein [Pirellula sp.]|nr:J domain-containing protein [Pirellula sp.]
MKTMAEDYYKVLGVERSASSDEITKAYRKLARKHHPDLNPDDKSAKSRFQEIQSAYDCLNDPEKRAKYDQFGSNYEQFAGGAGAGPYGAGPYGGGGQSFDFGDIFGGGQVDLGSIFGNMGGGARSRRTPRGSDVSAEISVPIKTMISGGETQISLNLNGKTDSISVKIPAGISPGKKIRLRGRGQSVLGGKPGDLLLTVHPEANPHYKLAGLNLELRLPITLEEAIKGAKVDVQTPNGTIALTVPPMSSSGKRLRLKGQGFRTSDGSTGDMIVELLIKLPDNVRPEVVDQLAELFTSYQRPVREGVQL